jgi:hypothetical protein
LLSTFPPNPQEWKLLFIYVKLREEEFFRFYILLFLELFCFESFQKVALKNENEIK